MSRIKRITGRDVFDSRDTPTIVDVILDNGIAAMAAVASSASTGTREAKALGRITTSGIERSSF